MSMAPKKSKVRIITAASDPEYFREVFMQMAECQNQIDDANVEASEEILQLEEMTNQMRKPFFVKRAESIKKIDKFWLTAMKNHPKISTVLHEDEDDCLLSLKKIEVDEDYKVKSGYFISFYFDENPYFENKVLTKEFTLDDLSKSTQIKWKEGKDLIKQVLAKPYSNEEKRYTEYISFFEWFSSDTDIVTDKIAVKIRDELWQNPLKYYLVPNVEPEADLS